ncbi:MAG: DUF3604 domain-containing protein [Rhizobiaceae bacterium]|nr:DUF3604 domain-containing protein [Rhizobiaceae bacterium]
MATAKTNTKQVADPLANGRGLVPIEHMGHAGSSVAPGVDPAIYGSASLAPLGPAEVRSARTFTLTYRVGRLGLDDTGSICVCFRVMSDVSPLQVGDPAAPNYVSAQCSGSGRIALSFNAEGGQRPWNKRLLARLQGGYLKEGDEITIVFGDTSGGSPGMMMQTFAEAAFEFRVMADVVATGHFVPLRERLSVPVVAGPAAIWKAVLPSLRRPGEAFHLGIKPEDIWGNPTRNARAKLKLVPSLPVEGLPGTIAFDGTHRARAIEGLRVTKPGLLTIGIFDGDTAIATAGPLVIRDGAVAGYWGDLHGQSGETVGVGTAESYFAFARDCSFLDVTSHQANDFQVNDTFWKHLNELTAAYDTPGRFIVFPGYEWSGNTAVGGDHNVFFRHEGRAIRRSSHALLPDRGDIETDATDLVALFEALKEEDAVVYAHVGGRYANINYAHDPRLETAVELHSAWGSFEWMLTDALEAGYRVGVVCNSDGHKGRPGASFPGASTFGAYGGLTCFLAPKLDRDAIFEAMRRRHHYGTTGSRMHIDLEVKLAEPGALYERDPDVFSGARSRRSDTAAMGDIVKTALTDAELAVAVHAPSPILDVTIFNGTVPVAIVRPYAEADLGNRIRVTCSGAEYRGRGRNTTWRGRARFSGNRIADFRRFNHWNRERRFEQQGDDTVVWHAITTGNMTGFDARLEGEGGVLDIDTNRGSMSVELCNLGLEPAAMEAGGLERRLSVQRLPGENPHTSFAFKRAIQLDRPGDNAVWIRVRTEDGHCAWTSPVYLVR